MRASFAGSAVTAVKPGTYTIIPSAGTLRATNYQFTTFVNGTLTILPVDFGDAPDSYHTVLTDNGGTLLDGGLHLGASVGWEADGLPGEASRDPDDDGVTFASVLRQGQPASVRVQASQAGGKLDAFLDFNADGDFSDPGEQVFSSVPLVAGQNELTFAVPADAESGLTYARFRISSAGGLSFDGLASDGEVEDYRITLGVAIANTPRADGRLQLDAVNVTPGGVMVFCYGTQLGSSVAFGVTLGLVAPVCVAQAVADPTGHARALLTLPTNLAGQELYYQAFEQGPNPQISNVLPTGPSQRLAPSPESGGEGSRQIAAARGGRAGPRRNLRR